MKLKTKIIIISAFLITGIAASAAQEDHGDVEEYSTGFATPDSALYGLETRWDSMSMTVGLSSASDVAEKRAGEARLMADHGDYEAAERAIEGLGNAAERSGEEDTERIENAVSSLDQVMETAPEEAQEGLQNAMDNVEQRGPEDIEPGQPTEDPQPDQPAQETPADEDTGVEQDQDVEQQPETDQEPENGEDTEQPGETQPDETDSEQQEDNDVREIVIEGESFEFNPDTVEVEVGQEVEFIFENTGGTHDLVISEVEGAGTEVIGTGESDSFTHTFEEEGEYEFICSVGNHAEQGMTGTIEVVE